MIIARCVTNLDPKHHSWKQDYIASFPAMPSVGQVFMWNEMRCKIIEIRWQKHPEAPKLLIEELQMVVEFNK